MIILLNESFTGCVKDQAVLKTVLSDNCGVAVLELEHRII